MKQKLLSTFLLASCICFAQAPITQFVNTTEQDYAILTSSTAVDESPTGENAVWNFTNFTQVGLNTDTYTSPAPTAIQNEYPGTTEIQTITTDGMPPVISNVFIKNDMGEISITGLNQGAQLELNLTNNATLGTFPLSYPYTFTDANGIGGTFDGDVDGTQANGTFSGSITTSVDAYGTLNLNDFGLGAYNGNVTRLKTEQVINLSVSVFGFPVPIGNVVQTVNNYYDDSDGRLVFRTSTNIFDINTGGQIFQDTVLLYEALDRSTLGLNDNTLVSTEVTLFPNPVRSTLNLKLSNNTSVTSLEVFDLNGRSVLRTNETVEAINVSGLQSGLYILNIETSQGFFTKRFIKR